MRLEKQLRSWGVAQEGGEIFMTAIRDLLLNHFMLVYLCVIFI